MAGATIWKGVIHFGKTEVPVKLHTAVREERIQFHLLHKSDSARLHQQMVCAYEQRPVAAEEQTRGFEVEKGKYLIIDREELEMAAAEGGRTIGVHEFVRTGQIDPFFLDRVYYLEPDGPGAGYAALVSALQEMGVEGVCTWSMRKRSYLGALRSTGKALRLTTLRYADEVVQTATLGLQDVPLSEKELAIGSELIDKLTAAFEPEKFGNEHEKKLRDLIDRKARGEEIAVRQPRRLDPTESDRLLEALEASLKKAA